MYADISVAPAKALADQFQKDGFKVLKEPRQLFAEVDKKNLMALYLAKHL